MIFRRASFWIGPKHHKQSQKAGDEIGRFRRQISPPIFWACLWCLGPIQKDARRNIMNFGGTKTSRSLTTTWLVTKTMEIWFFKALFWGVYARLPGAHIFRNLILQSPFWGVYATMPAARIFRNLNFQNSFWGVYAPLPGAHIFRNLNFQSSFWGVYAPLPGSRIFRNLTFQSSFWGV